MYPKGCHRCATASTHSVRPFPTSHPLRIVKLITDYMSTILRPMRLHRDVVLEASIILNLEWKMKQLRFSFSQFAVHDGTLNVFPLSVAEAKCE